MATIDKKTIGEIVAEDYRTAQIFKNHNIDFCCKGNRSIREACERLRRPEDARLPVLSIALGVGYGSIGPFNRAFKARVGMRRARPRERLRPRPDDLGLVPRLAEAVVDQIGDVAIVFGDEDVGHGTVRLYG